jgi:hypothetical protein
MSEERHLSVVEDIDEEQPDVGLDPAPLFELLRAVYWADEGSTGWRDDLLDVVGSEAEELGNGYEPLWRARQTVQGMVRAARSMLAAIDDELLAMLGPAGAVRLDDYLLRASSKTKRHLVDREGLLDWLGDDWREAINVSRADIYRVTALREIARQRDEDPDMALDSFFETEQEDGQTLAVMREGQSGFPKYAERMEHGQTRGALQP